MFCGLVTEVIFVVTMVMTVCFRYLFLFCLHESITNRKKLKKTPLFNKCTKRLRLVEDIVGT